MSGPADLTFDADGVPVAVLVEPDDAALDPAADFRALPEPVAFDDLVEAVDTEAAPDPNGGRDTETEFMLRNAL